MSSNSKSSWRKRAREYLARAFGGKCTICGYDKIIAALDYHHVDSESKDKALSIAMRNGSSWSKIVEEARKCTIVCCRCHRELHAGVVLLPEKYAIFNEEYANILTQRKRKKSNCLVCGKEKYAELKFCSHKCAHFKQKKFHVEKDELEKLISAHTFVAIGKMFGVTDNSIRKRCRKLGIAI